jgi:hypothetical protein
MQLRKRIPIDLAPVLGVQPFLMAKALGCFLAAESRMAVAAGEDDRSADAIASALLDAEGHSGDGAWGYEFDVQTRWGFYAAREPNLIATTFVGRGFLEAGLVFQREDWLAQAAASARFLDERLLRSVRGSARRVLTYTHSTDAVIHNANLLGAGFCAVVGRVTGDQRLTDRALEAAAVSCDALRADGTWPYGEGSRLGWADNFHTAYDLDGLAWVWLATQSDEWKAALLRGISVWRDSFFSDEGAPYYTREAHFPLDIHSAATAVDVACRLEMDGFDCSGLAEAVASWTEHHLINPKTGLTHHQVHRGWTDLRNFRRWGDAHWALARSSMQLRRVGLLSPVEARFDAERAARSLGTDGPQAGRR